MRVDIKELKDYIEHSGLKQKAVAERSGMGEIQFCMVLQGKRKFEAGEYAGICNVLDVPMTKFIKPRLPDGKEVG